MEYKLSPSDLTFLYDGCKHCFVLKVKHGISQPSIPIPGIFSLIASLQKDYYSDMRTEDFCLELPLTPISKLGLLYFTPDSCEYTSANQQILKGNLDFIEVQRDDASFNEFLRDAVQLLDGPLPQPEPDNCDWCAFLEKIGKISDLTEEGKTVTEIPKCPSCGGPMRLRTGKYGEFWSCLKFPDCKGTRNS